MRTTEFWECHSSQDSDVFGDVWSFTPLRVDDKWVAASFGGTCVPPFLLVSKKFNKLSRYLYGVSKNSCTSRGHGGFCDIASAKQAICPAAAASRVVLPSQCQNKVPT